MGADEVVTAGAVVAGVVDVPELQPEMMNAQTSRTTRGIKTFFILITSYKLL